MQKSKYTREQALTELLLSLFRNTDEVLSFVLSLPGGKNLMHSINFQAYKDSVVFDVMDQLRTRGLIDADLFDQLQRLAPNRSEIKEIRNQWLMAEESWTSLPATDTPTESNAPQAPTVIVYYAHRDRPFYEELMVHLTLLARKGLIKIWHEGRISAGDQWAKLIKSEIEKADFHIILVSPDFLISSEYKEVLFELNRQVNPHETKYLIPIIVRPSLWHDTPIRDFKALPLNSASIEETDDPDLAWFEVSKQLEQIAKSWRAPV